MLFVASLLCTAGVASGLATDVNRRAALGAAARQGATLALGPMVLPTAAAAAVAAAASSSSQPVQLGKLGIGTWAWGDPLFWGYNPKFDGELAEVFDLISSSPAAGFVDTAEVYGFGRSETLIGDFAAKIPNYDTPIATKFAALPWRTKSSDVVKACEASLKRIGREKIDLYQIHFPNGWSNAEYWDGLAECVDRGLVKSVGVSNYGSEALRACHAALAARGVPLKSNQIQYSLLYRYPEENGLLATCKELDVDVLAYSPLGLGLLTGKFTRDNKKLPDGPRKQLFETYLADERYVSLQATMSKIALAHGAVEAAVAINWCRAKGTIPIAGARNLKQAKQNLAALDWDLTPAEVKEIDRVAAELPWLGITPPFADKDIFTGMKMFDS